MKKKLSEQGDHVWLPSLAGVASPPEGRCSDVLSASGQLPGDRGGGRAAIMGAQGSRAHGDRESLTGQCVEMLMGEDVSSAVLAMDALFVLGGCTLESRREQLLPAVMRWLGNSEGYVRKAAQAALGLFLVPVGRDFELDFDFAGGGGISDRILPISTDQHSFDAVGCDRFDHLLEPKPVGKFVGYAAEGLGCLLIQSAKAQNSKEHVNPLAVIYVKSGQMTENILNQGFTDMFEWNWIWKAKRQADNLYVMRFPNKQKIAELTKFAEFTLLGTGCKIEVKAWTHDVTAKGKLHLVWVKLYMVPETMRHWKGYAEICSSLGVFKGVDIEILKEKEVVRCQVGVRDPTKIPTITEVTSEDLMIHVVGVLLESVIEPGWYNSGTGGKRVAREAEGQGGDRSENSQDPKKSRTAEGDENDPSTNKELPQQNQSDGINEEEYESQSVENKEGLDDDDDEVVEDSLECDAEKVDLEGHESDYLEETQSTPFGEKIERIQRGEYHVDKHDTSQEERIEKLKEANIPVTDEEKVLMVRRCSRLAPQEGQKVEERAIERAKVKNLCAEAGNLIPSYLDVDNPSLAETALVVGIDLGVSMEGVEENIEIAKDLEAARLNLFLRNNLSENQNENNMDPPPIGDVGFPSDDDFSDCDDDLEDDLIDKCLEKF
ncbi:hypothetical protein ACQ4PT_014075 [Festuca glaucescens]